MNALPVTSATVRLRRVSTGLLTALVMGVASLSSGPALAQSVFAARVNGVGIPAQRLERQFEALLRERQIHIARLQNPARARELRREALDRLIGIELLGQQARALGLEADDAAVERAITEARSRFRSAEVFAQRIAIEGHDEASHREHTRKLLSGERLAQRIVDREVHITEADIAAFHEANPALFRRPEQVRVRQLLVALPADAEPALKAQARSRIEALLVRARAGESFEALARTHSDAPTRQWGGALDPFGRGSQPRAIEDAAFALAPGALSEVIETSAGWQILQLDERIAAVSVPLDEVRERIRRHLHDGRGQQAVEREIARLREQGRVELLMPL
ncbi:PpiC-type peptidyl-prolyl cis-trans isomerase [Leptothrix cholodnii SP-6]|uniref:peptidylprolyl isomerase n=1 Tax=Leptothrix cholodnii (strain ATCC 51168 / LMG 8142 / SP-6) TaxID=395495 RepID=B1Y7J4_LEPCP|nr:peptidyl-prolyl cis-trans isomerase [Leptothrix cholodnii]ACB36142.1 PpiC-type peptidyl-prolyl cis-trans isomerase [Leptothrix cholodnii SP-6]